MNLSEAPAIARWLARITTEECMVCQASLREIGEVVIVAQELGSRKWVAAGSCCFQKLFHRTIVCTKIFAGENPSKKDIHLAKSKIWNLLSLQSDIPPWVEVEARVTGEAKSKAAVSTSTANNNLIEFRSKRNRRRV